MIKMIKHFESEIKGIDEKEGTMVALISTGGMDRQRESLDPDGVDMRNYKKNPVVLWAHDYSQLPIGKALWVKKEGNGIVAKIKFASHELAQEVKQLYTDGIMKAFSVGFIPKEYEDATDKDWNDPKKPRRTYKSWELLEFSAVPVPANPEALALAFSKGLIKSEFLKSAFDPIKEEPIQEFNNEEEKEVLEVKTENHSEELMAEVIAKDEQIKALEQENSGLRYKLYVSLKQKSNSEITEDVAVKTFEDVALRVIRKAQGKLD